MRIQDTGIITAGFGAFVFLTGCGADAPPIPDAIAAPTVEDPPAPPSTSPPDSDTKPSQPKPAPTPEPGIDLAKVTCATKAPANAPKALPLPAYAACPTLAVPPALTTIASSGSSRTFLAYRPATIAANERLPVVFIYHWLGGDAPSAAEAFEVQAAVEKHRFIGVIPNAKGDVLFKWPFGTKQTQARVDEETKFFDDMLACVGAGLPIETECVSSMGVSAGALWTAQLAVARSERLASIVSLSGGVGEDLVRPWTTTPHRLPALVLWGGSDDFYQEKTPLLHFDDASKNLEDALAKDGHFIVECTHACGHDMPPFVAPPGGARLDAVWSFVLDHPYWLAPGTSPYTLKPTMLPTWCSAGGKATPSTTCPY